MRDPDNIDDVLKVSTRGDDAYDAFRYGIYGMYRGSKNKPNDITIEEHAKTLGPMEAYFYRMKMQNQKSTNVPFLQKEQPVWQGKAGL
jgi:hypothetical protein